MVEGIDDAHEDGASKDPRAEDAYAKSLDDPEADEAHRHQDAKALLMSTSAGGVGKSEERQHVAALKLVGQILLTWVAIWFGSLLIYLVAWKVFGLISRLETETDHPVQVIAAAGCFLLAAWRVTGFWRRKGLSKTPSILINIFGGVFLFGERLPAFALVVPFVSLVVALILPGSAAAGRDEATMKTCPFCAEDIKAAAIACRHCGRDLPEGGQPVAAHSSTGGSTS